MCYRFFPTRWCGQRRLDPRIESSPRRCAGNLLKYTEKICRRMGLWDGKIRVALHDRHGNPVGFSTKSSFPDERKKRRSRPPQIRPGTGQGPRWPDEMKWLLFQRMKRLLRHSGLAYGEIVFYIKDGEIDRIRFSKDFRRKLDKLDELVDTFGGAPPSAAWSMGSPGVGP